jgi:hypothetical protein
MALNLGQRILAAARSVISQAGTALLGAARAVGRVGRAARVQAGARPLQRGGVGAAPPGRTRVQFTFTFQDPRTGRSVHRTATYSTRRGITKGELETLGQELGRRYGRDFSDPLGGFRIFMPVIRVTIRRVKNP